MELEDLYRNRFNQDEQQRKNAMWEVLCDVFFSKYINEEDDVLDIAAGYCEFINNIWRNATNAGRRIAIDMNPDIKLHAHSGIEVFIGQAQELHVIQCKVDVIFISNFFEHVREKKDILKILKACESVLNPKGKILILQPNIKYLYREYWDFFDHYTPLSDQSMVEAINMVQGLKVNHVIKKFFPYTTKSRLPQWRWLIKLYCHLPLAWKLFGKQMFIVATKES